MRRVDEVSLKSAVVIGGGVAGTACALELRAIVRSDLVKISLIDPQPAVKIATLVGKVTRTAVDVSIGEQDAKDWCKGRGIDFLKDRVVRIAGQEVLCESGDVIPFDVCCIASGARPYIPPALRDEEIADRVVTLRDNESVESLTQKLASATKVVIVGGGGIAMELVHEVHGCDIVWVMKGSHVGSAFFDQRGGECALNLFQLEKTDEIRTATMTEGNSTGGTSSRPPQLQRQALPTAGDPGGGVGPEWISKRFEPVIFGQDGSVQERPVRKNAQLSGRAGEKRMRFMLNVEIERVEKQEGGQWPMVVTLTDRSQVGCDLILVGTGVVPNTDWLRGSAVAVDWAGNNDMVGGSKHDAPGGVLVSAEDFCSSVPGIFAAGDCMTVRVGTAGVNWFQMRLWSQGMASGRACAQGMAQFLHGEHVEYMGLDFEVFAHVTKFFSKKVVLLGRYNAQGLSTGFELLESGGDDNDDYYVRAVIEKGRVRGALLVGEVEAAETFENLILNGLDVTSLGAELVDPSIDLDDYFD